MTKKKSSERQFASPIYDSVIVRVKSTTNDKRGDIFLWHSDQSNRMRMFGEVITTPKMLKSNKPLMITKHYQGWPKPGVKGHVEVEAAQALYSNELPQFYHQSDIKDTVVPGDTIYFNYNTFMNKRNYVDRDPEYEYWLVPYFNIICRVLGTPEKPEYDMVGSYVLMTPITEDWEDILLPTYYNIGGEKHLKPKDKWIATKSKPENKYLQAIIEAVGDPLKGDALELSKGDRVIYSPESDWPVYIQDKEYWVTRQTYIEAIIK
jgi:co-chaperonin GroES (HSP10)